MKLSVIIPGYNTSQFEWERCINSVKQAVDVSKFDAEIICVDDGSRDNASFLDGRDDLIVIHQANQGPSVARNAALAIARGDWVSFVDSDDVLHKDTYKEAFRTIGNTNCDIVVFGVETIWPSIKVKKDDVVPEMNMGELSPANLNVLQKNNLLNYVWNKIYRRGFLVANEIAFPLDAVMGEDLIFNLQCVISGAKWATVDYIGYTYYRTTTTLLSRYKPKYISGLLRTDAMWKSYNRFAKRFSEGSLRVALELDRTHLDKLEWKNIWMPNSPYNFWAKIQWLREHPHVGGGIAFGKMFLYTFLRRYFYFNSIRRWHIKRMYPHAKDVE